MGSRVVGCQSARPAYQVETHRASRRRKMAFPDGYWNADNTERGVGVFVSRSTRPAWPDTMSSAHLARGLLASEATKKVQRTTQSEPLAIIVVLLIWPEVFRKVEVLVVNDSKPP